MSEHEKQKTFLQLIKNYLVVLCAPGVILSVVGYVAKQRIDSRHQREQQEYQAHKDTYTTLYKEGQSKIIALRNSKDKLFSLLENSYGISSFDMKPYLSEFEQNLKSYDQYVTKIEFEGHPAQLASAEEIQDWSHNIYSKFQFQSSSAERVQESIRYMAINSYDKAIKDPEAYSKFYLEKILRELDLMVQGENELYYEFKNLENPIFDALYNSFIHNFRVASALETTNQKNKSIEIFSRIEILMEKAEHRNNSIPYLVAEQRSILSNNFTAEPEKFFEQKNSWLKMQLLGKFMEQVGDNDPYLKKKKKENIDSL